MAFVRISGERILNRPRKYPKYEVSKTLAFQLAVWLNVFRVLVSVCGMRLCIVRRVRMWCKI